MASKSVKGGKKVVNQDELRRLMREKKKQVERQKRVESPYAKYNSLGQLSCVLCNVQVKTEILWQAHVLGKQHRDKVSELKGDKQGGVKIPETPQTSTLKRKAAEPEVHEGKKPKASSGADLPQGTSGPGAGLSQGKTSGPSAGLSQGKTSGLSAGLRLLAGQYDDDDDDDDEDEEGTGAGKAPGDAQQSDGLPADFFDSTLPGSASHSGSVPKADEEQPADKKDHVAEALPEGFFDDPVRDAKVRNVDTPKDHMDKEWEEFQKEMRLVSNVSEAIVAEEDEEGRLERQIDEIDEQIECLRRVEVLRTKQDVVKDKVKKALEELRRRAGNRGEDGEDEDAEDEDDEEELMNVLGRDWRAKGALA